MLNHYLPMHYVYLSLKAANGSLFSPIIFIANSSARVCLPITSCRQSACSLIPSQRAKSLGIAAITLLTTPLFATLGILSIGYGCIKACTLSLKAKNHILKGIKLTLFSLSSLVLTTTYLALFTLGLLIPQLVYPLFRLIQKVVIYLARLEQALFCQNHPLIIALTKPNQPIPIQAGLKYLSPERVVLLKANIESVFQHGLYNYYNEALLDIAERCNSLQKEILLPEQWLNQLAVPYVPISPSDSQEILNDIRSAFKEQAETVYEEIYQFADDSSPNIPYLLPALILLSQTQKKNNLVKVDHGPQDQVHTPFNTFEAFVRLNKKSYMLTHRSLQNMKSESKKAVIGSNIQKLNEDLNSFKNMILVKHLNEYILNKLKRYILDQLGLSIPLADPPHSLCAEEAKNLDATLIRLIGCFAAYRTQQLGYIFKSFSINYTTLIKPKGIKNGG